MSSVSGRSPEHRAEMRRIVAHGCEIMLDHKGAVHYSMEGDRWEGIDKRLLISKGQFPKHSDCSSSSTWLHWNAAVAHFPTNPGRDVLNGLRWTAGFTGTLLQHGKVVEHEDNILVGDLALYGIPGTTGKHVAVCLGGGLVFSHGSEGGPYKLDLHYRSDLMVVRRYI